MKIKQKTDAPRLAFVFLPALWAWGKANMTDILNKISTTPPILFIALILVSPGLAQPPDRSVLETLTERHLRPSLEVFREFLEIPNDGHSAQHVEHNMQWMEKALAQRSFTTRRLETAGAPLLLAQRPATGAKQTLLIYLHIDGQPVDPSRWDQDSPYSPVLKENVGGHWRRIPWDSLSGTIDPEWRIFARSASDAKGPVMMLMTALDILTESGWPQNSHLKIIMDFEEEMGSPNLPPAVPVHREALQADRLIMLDGPRHYSNRPTLTFGARGIATLELVVHGARVAQHSGHFGNYAPNPAQRLAELLASMEDGEGRVTIPGFYDGVVLDQAALDELSEVPDDEVEILSKMGVAEPERVGATLQQAIQYPSLNVRGMASGWVGEAVRTIIPSSALAEIDIRLAPETSATRLTGLVRDHILQQGYVLVSGEPTDQERARHPRIASLQSKYSYEAFRTPLSSPLGTWLTGALERAFGAKPVRIRMSGGSIPMAPFIGTLNTPVVMVPTVNSDNNQHSPNENLRIGNYEEGIRTFLAILTEPLTP